MNIHTKKCDSSGYQHSENLAEY